MHPKEPQELDFTLDDIIREFSDNKDDDFLAGLNLEPAPAIQQSHSAAAVVEDTVRIAPAEPEPQPVSAPVSQETAVFQPVSQETAVFQPVSQETAVFQPVSQDTAEFPSLEDTAVFQPVGDDTVEFQSVEEDAPIPEEMPDLVPPPEPEQTPPEAQEAFSDDWEPEYDEPMGEYTQPIAFPSQNRQHILRKKLVSGPEKLYHKMVSAGMGGLQAGIVISFALLILSAIGTLLPVFTPISPNNMRLLVFGQLTVIMVTGLLACYRLLVGIGNVIRGRFTLNALLLVSFIACTVDGFLCLKSQQMPCATALCLSLLMAQWAEYQRRTTQLSQMDTLRKALEVTAMVKLPNYYEGRAGYVPVEGDPDVFMEEYHKRPMPEKRLDLFGLMALGISLVLMVYVGFAADWTTAVRVLSAGLLAAVPATALIIISRPIAILEGRLHRLGAVLCGWKGIREADRHMIYPLRHNDLFPKECAKMNGVKFYGSIDPARVVAFSAALINQDGEGMMGVFSHLPRSRNVQQYEVTEFIAYPGGITGLVDGCPVMVGTQDFMAEMGVPVPDEARIPHAVYASLAGQFSGVFATQYSRSKSSAAGLRSLCGYHRIRPVLVDCDFILTDQFIRTKLSVNPRRVEFPEREVRQHLASTPVPENAPVVALVTKNGFAPKAFAITGARVLRATLVIGAAVHILAGVLGLGAVTILAMIGAFDSLTALNLLAYSMVWLLPGLLITEWTRYI